MSRVHLSTSHLLGFNSILRDLISSKWEMAFKVFLNFFLAGLGKTFEMLAGLGKFLAGRRKFWLENII